MSLLLKCSLIAVAAALSTSAYATGGQLPGNAAGQDPNTGNSSAVANWRFAPGQVFNGVAGALDGVARISSTNSQGNWACSGSLLQGGQYVLTAAHCADDFTSMTVQFGWFAGSAAVTRTVTAATLHPGWLGFNSSADAGIDLAIVKLATPVTTIQGYALSTTNDVGMDFLMAGYGTTTLGSSNVATNWNDGSYGHYGYNTFDVTSKTFNQVVDAVTPGWGYDPTYYVGTTYMSDYDGPSNTYNTLGKVAGFTGGFSSNAGLGANEALIAGGDSGGGDFVFGGFDGLFGHDLRGVVGCLVWNFRAAIVVGGRRRGGKPKDRKPREPRKECLFYKEDTPLPGQSSTSANCFSSPPPVSPLLIAVTF